MKIIDRFISFLLTLLVIVIAVAIFMGAIDLISYDSIINILKEYVFVSDPKLKLEVAAISVLVILLGLKVTVFSADLTVKSKKNIVVNTNHGKIQISQDTLEEIATSVAKEHSEVKEIAARMTKATKGINMYLMLTIYKTEQINELLSKVQEEVKERIETTTTVNVNNVDIKIKNVIQSSKAVSAETKVVAKEENVVAKETNVSASEATPTDVPDGYMRDSNNILYKVEPNENTSHE